MAKFYLRSKKEKGTAGLYVDINRPSLAIRWKVATGIMVDVAAWNKAQTSARAMAKYFSTEEGKEVQEHTRAVEDIIDSLFRRGAIRSSDDKEILESHIFDVVNVEGLKREAEAEELAKRLINEEREKENNRLCVVKNYYADFYKRIESGELRQGRRREAYRANSLSVWRTFGKHLNGYLKKRHCQEMTFSDINKAFADGFTNYLEGEGLMLATINQQVNCFRRLCNAAAEDERNSNAVSLRVWHSHEEKDEDKRAEIVLSEDEIDALCNMPLEGMKEQARDMWLLGYFCAQRVSDYSRLTMDNFKETASGLKVIALRQQKTGKELLVPILDDRVFEICAKYDYVFPSLNREQLNRIIKQVAKELGESVPSLKEWNRTLLSVKERQKEENYICMCARVEGGEKLQGEEAKRYKRMKEYAEEHESGEMLYRRDYAGNVIRQRWELITCHTSRRSAVTAMYDSGIYDLKDIMAVSGHQTLKNVEKYLKRDTVKQAERIAEKARKAKEMRMKKEA